MNKVERVTEKYLFMLSQYLRVFGIRCRARRRRLSVIIAQKIDVNVNSVGISGWWTFNYVSLYCAGSSERIVRNSLILFVLSG